MEKNRFRLIFALACLVMAMAGCGDTRRLEAENRALREALRQGSAQRQADLAYVERQAGIAAGCDFLVPMCPEAITRPGREMQARGIGGGAEPIFWIMVMGKMAALGVLIVVLVLGWIRIGRPSAAAVAEAERVIREAGQAAMEERRRADRVAHLEGEISTKAKELAQMEAALADATAAVDEKKRKFEKIKAARAALASFK